MQPENLIKRDFIAKKTNQNITHAGEKKDFSNLFEKS